MDGFTGFNPNQAMRDINITEGHLFVVYEEYRDASRDFINDLTDVWASDNAVAFGKQYIPLINNSVLHILKMQRSLSKMAREAFNVIARANGADAMQISEDDLVNEVNNSISDDYKPFKDNYAGTIGMNVMLAKSAIENFNEQMKFVFHDLDTVPIDIAFYDPNGEMATAFKNELEKIKGEITTLTEEMKNSVNTAMSEEMNTILLAKEQAVQSMNG